MTQIIKEYNGINYTVGQQTIDDLLKLHGVDAIQEIEAIIDSEENTARLSVTKER